MSKIKFENVLLCDLATRSENNKYTVVNLYSGTDLIISAPGVISTSLYVEQIPDRTGDMELTIDYYLDDTVIANVKVQGAGLIKGRMGVFIVPPFPINISGPGKLRLVAKAEGYHNTTILTKNVIVGPIPSPTA